jgi:hypothetical protein
MTRIFIEDNELDINAGFSQMINYSIDDLNNLDSKTTSFTKTIVLPGTSKNNRLLGNIFDFGNSNFTVDSAPNFGYNFNASKSAKARIEVNGMQVIKGVMRLMEILIDGENVEYEVALFGELGGFFSKLGASKLTDLDFSAYNHTYNVTNIVNSWDNASGGSGYYYPLIDYGNTSPINNLNFYKKSFYFTAFRPAFFVKEYINKIITQAGYTWESNFFNTDFFKRLIIPNNQVRLKYNRDEIFESTINPASPTISTSQNLVHTNIVTDLFTNVSSTTFTYTPAQAFVGEIGFTFRGTYTVQNISALDTQFRYAFATVRVYKNGSVFYIDTNRRFGGYATTTGGLLTGPTYNFTLRYPPIPITFNTGDTWKMDVFIFDTNGALLNVTSNSSGVSISTANPILVTAQYGDDLLVNGSLPQNILQKDFFASILKMFNLMVTEDKFTDKKLVIEPYVDFYDTDRTTYNDWSDKVDRSQVIKIKPMSEINARYYDIKFKQDADYFNEQYRKKYIEGYGDFRFDNQLDFAKDTSATEVIFSASPLVGYSANDKIFPAIYKLNNGTEEMIEHNIRIMQAKKITGRTSWKIYNKVLGVNTVLTTTTAYGYAGHLDNPFSAGADLNFGVPKEINFTLASGLLSNNLFNTYYSPYFAEITDKDSRLITCKMKLTERDINTLDFTKFIWIDGVLYRLYKIVDYAENELCEVQLLRVIYTTY